MPPKEEKSANDSKMVTPVTMLQTTNVPEFNPNVESWNVWKERLEIHFCEVNCTDDNVRKSILLKSIGAVPYKVLHSLCSPATPVSKSFKELCEILDTQYTPPTIVFSERKIFHISTKQESESVAEWYARVKMLALNCKFGVNLDAFVLNQFVMGLPNFIFERLCEEDENLTIQSALRKAMILETKCIIKGGKEETAVNFVKKQKHQKQNNGSGNSNRGNSSSDNRGNGGNSNRGKWGSSNRGCGDNGSNRDGGRDNRGDEITEAMVRENFLVLTVVGEYDASITFKGNTKTVVVVVVDSANPPLLGRTFLRSFNFELLQINNINFENNNAAVVEQLKIEFAEVFEDKLGEFKNSQICLKVVENATPVFCKPRPLPLAWKAKVEKQLRDLISSGVLEPVDNSDWGTPLVPVLKPNGDLRICGDYKITINKFLEDFKYPLPRIDEIFASLEGGEIFTKLDLSNAYNQLILDDESQLLCAWSTHIGTLKVKRLPFGVKTAAAIFQKTMESLLRNIPFVVVYQDDITVTGKTMQSHIKTLRLVLQKLQNAGLKLNIKNNLKPPTTKEKIIESQHNNINNHKGNRHETFQKGQNVMVRDYRNPNKPSWTQAVVEQQLGPQSYSCTLAHNKHSIKRHLDQIRNQQIQQHVETNMQMLSDNNTALTVANEIPTMEDFSRTRRELRPREGATALG
ncbi:uncharacterized protein LOC129240599 [Anastrepha obliqua]|uniref:uncharacterized protein LOC129240599 n=1 Tax=Anastrepha obliqua TaxID=95512 RepID=UPI0024094D34|nr:uncharacterized protein LOC129240599 [Anastrepha obliqua]